MYVRVTSRVVQVPILGRSKLTVAFKNTSIWRDAVSFLIAETPRLESRRKES